MAFKELEHGIVHLILALSLVLVGDWAQNLLLVSGDWNRLSSWRNHHSCSKCPEACKIFTENIPKPQPPLTYPSQRLGAKRYGKQELIFVRGKQSIFLYTGRFVARK
jgi:hypothetical protein